MWQLQLLLAAVWHAGNGGIAAVPAHVAAAVPQTALAAAPAVVAAICAASPHSWHP